MSQIFYCNWGGTNLINSSPPSGEDTYSAVNNESAGTWEKLTDGLGWNGDTNYAQSNTKSAGRSCGITGLSLTNKLAFRFMFKLDTMGMNDGQKCTLKRFATGGDTANGGVRLHNDGGTPKVIGQGRDDTNTLTEFGSVTIETGKWYQIEMIYEDNAANGASFKVWNESGSTQIGTTQTCSFTTYNAANLTQQSIGSISGFTGSANKMLFNRDTIYDDNVFPGPIVTGNPYYAYQQQN